MESEFELLADDFAGSFLILFQVDLGPSNLKQDDVYRRTGQEACPVGLIPIIIDPDERERMHGIDERISLKNLALGSRVVADVVEKV